MKVGILSQWFPPETGPASIPGVLARGLVERGHEVTVLTGFPNYPTGDLYDGYRIRAREDSTEHGYAIRRVALYPDHSPTIKGRLLNYGSFAATASAVGVSALKGIDVLWVYNSPATLALPMWLVRARYRVPIVLHNMDMWPDSVIHTGFAPNRGAKALFKGLNAWVDLMYRSATMVAYLTPSAGVELQRRGVPATKLAHAPVWVDESVFKPTDGTALRRRLGFSDTDIVVGYAGALGKAQSVVELAQAVRAMPESSPVRCLILGAGTESAKVAEIARRSVGKIRFLGQVPHSDMTEYAAVPDISFVGLSAGGDQSFAAPSKIPAIMACARPLLASVRGDSADLVHASGAGWVVSPGDACGLSVGLELAAQQGTARLRALGVKARRFYEKRLSAESGVSRVEYLLREALTRSSGQPDQNGNSTQLGLE